MRAGLAGGGARKKQPDTYGPLTCPYKSTSGAVGISLLQLAQERTGVWAQKLTRRADIMVAGRIIGELILAEQARRRGASLPPRHVRNDTGLLAGLDVIDLEITLVCRRVDCFDAKNFLRGLRGLL